MLGQLRSRFPSILGALVALTISSVSGANPGGVRTFRVTIENLTPSRGGGASQVLSPSLALVHTQAFDLFEVGQPAVPAVVDVAEDAIVATGLSAFAGNPAVGSVAAYGGPLPPGQSLTFEVQARGNANRLSLVTMLVSTNDGFTGLDGVQLSGGTTTHLTMAYDAGSEANDQLRASIPGPCCGDTGRNGVDQHGIITHHPGILAGVGDLDPLVWGWPDAPVARITVERVR